jgi:hypothetical protein
MSVIAAFAAITAVLILIARLANDTLRSDRWTAIGVITMVFQTALLVGALLYARRQVIDNRSTANIERVLELHATLTSGEVGDSRFRLSTALWLTPERFGSSSDGRLCGRLWTGDRRNHEAYQLDVFGDAAASTAPSQDMHRILWCFQRAGEAFELGTVDKPLFVSMIGNHVMWWDMALRYRPRPEAAAIDDDANDVRRAAHDAPTGTDLDSIGFDAVARQALRRLARQVRAAASDETGRLWNADLVGDFGLDAVQS